MKKIIGKISWIIAIIGVFTIALIITIVDNYILFYTGIGMLVIGIWGALFTGEKTKEAIYRLLNFI